MNQTRIFCLAKVYLQETDLTITEALEPQINDQINRPWSYEEMDLILQAEQAVLDDKEEQLLQQTLAESFDISHPEFDHRLAIANLRRQFSASVDLCKKCLHVKHQDELDMYHGYCQDCAHPPVSIYEPPTPEPVDPPLNPTNATLPEPDPLQPQVTQLQQQVEIQNQLISQLQQKVDKLERFTQTLLQAFQQDAQAI